MPRRQLRWPGPTKGRPARGPPSTCAARPRRRTTAISTHQLPKIGFWYLHVPKQEQPKIEDLCPFGKIKSESFQKKNVHQEITYHASLRLAKKAKITSSWRLVKDRPKNQNSTSHIWRFRSCLLRRCCDFEASAASSC